MTHTPGPWELNTEDTGLNDSGTILGAGVVIVPDIYGRSKVECDANAALIAAAPDLYAMLARMLDSVLRLPDRPNTISLLDLEQARAAIAKAEGRMLNYGQDRDL